MPRGGRRPGAGRKPKEAVLRAIAVAAPRFEKGEESKTSIDSRGIDVLEAARRTRIEVMLGEGGAYAVSRLQAANAILAADQLHHLTDEQLEAEAQRIVAEVRRRRREKHEQP